MHTCCWNLAKKKFKHELTFEDFFNNKFEKIIPSKQKIDYYDYYLIKYLNYKPAYKYTLEKYWDYNIDNHVNDFLLNKMDWYIVYLPYGNMYIIAVNKNGVKRWKKYN